ncbi:MAG: DNA gyrase inhibitor YacG [Mariprofundaceae bacterium]|nr:DNA gyrase inhibitor YacG [Mariprofundaceae bacterium]
MKRLFFCPICKSELGREAVDFPFCCERCRLIDLGNWSDGSYAIPSDEQVVEDEEPNRLLN